MIQALSRVACADGFVRRGHVAKMRCIFTEEGFVAQFLESSHLSGRMTRIGVIFPELVSGTTSRVDS